MKEIEFRAWDNTNKCMYSNGYICLKWDGIYQVLNPTNMIKREDFMLMQYTGLKDKNGVEIYEGDIVKGNYLRGIGVVEWNKYFCKFDISHRMNISPSDEFEVIGNIYENPELLEDKQ